MGKARDNSNETKGVHNSTANPNYTYTSEWSENKWLYIPVIFFCTGAFLGYFLTMRDLLNESNWFKLCFIRVCWQWGCAIWLGLAMLTKDVSIKTKLIWLSSFTLIGFLLCYNAVFDLMKGEEKITGKINALEWVEHFAPSGTKYGTSSSYEDGEITIDMNGEKISVLMFDDAASNLLDLSKNKCLNGEVTVLYLRNLQAVLHYGCAEK